MTEKNTKSMVEQHAMKRLHQVEKARRKPYTNKSLDDEGFNWMNVTMQVLMIIVLISMLLSIT